MDLFSEPSHIYIGEEKSLGNLYSHSQNIIGRAGDQNIGEYIHLYLQYMEDSNPTDGKIVRARFSTIGSVVMIAIAEKFCMNIENKTFQEALFYCDPIELQKQLFVPDEKMYLINFVIEAFYSAFEILINK